MDLAARKYNFIQELTKVDETILEKLEKVLKASLRKTDWYNQLSEQEISEIEIGINQADHSEFKSHDEVMKKFEKWGQK